MTPASETDTSFVESAAEAIDMAVQVGTTCTEGVGGAVGTMMSGGSLRTCAEMQKWPAAGYDKTRLWMGMWCCVPQTVAEVVGRCEARGGRCMTDMRGKVIDDCVDQGNVWDAEATGYCPDGAGGPAGPKGNRCCLPKDGAKPIPLAIRSAWFWVEKLQLRMYGIFARVSNMLPPTKERRDRNKSERSNGAPMVVRRCVAGGAGPRRKSKLERPALAPESTRRTTHRRSPSLRPLQRAHHRADRRRHPRRPTAPLGAARRARGRWRDWL